MTFAVMTLLSICAIAHAQTTGTILQEVVIEGSRNSQMGIAESASAGAVTRKQLEARTVYRPGELLEATPGLIVSQHSGEGKANQFYLRGLNLDHGTDCAPASMECSSMPVRMLTARAGPISIS